MSMPIQPPFAVKAAYQNSQYGTDVYTQGGSQVFSHLVTPPSSGVAAETAADTGAHAVGFSAYGARNEVQVVTITGSPSSGDFKLVWGDDTTDAIAYNAAASTVQAQLNALTDAPLGTGGTNEVQTITIGGGATAGNFTLTYSGQTTANIPFGSAGSVIQAALIALSNLAPGDVVVTGSTSPYTATFGGTLAKQDVTAMTASAAGLTGGTPTAVITTATPGVATTPSITVAGSNGGPYTVTFNNVLAGDNVALLHVTAVNLTGGTNPAVTVTTTAGGRTAFYNQALQNAHQQFDGMRNQYDSASGNHW